MNRLKKLLAGTMLAALAVTAVAPATVSANHSGGKNIPEKLLALQAKTGKFDTLIAGATCEAFRTDKSDPLSSIVITTLAELDHGTLFGPTDRAFRKSLGLDASNICTAVDPQKVLLPILLLHVTDDRVTYWELLRKARRGGTIDTLGGDVDVNRGGGKWWRPRLGDDNARIIANVRAKNGQIKVVNRVILQS